MSHAKKRICGNLKIFGFAMALPLSTVLHAEEALVALPSTDFTTTSIESGASGTMAIVVNFAVVMQMDGNIGPDGHAYTGALRRIFADCGNSPWQDVARHTRATEWPIEDNGTDPYQDRTKW